MAGGERTLLGGRFRIVKQLGQGGMGSVWLAEDTQLDNKQFAIKMLPSILVSNKRAYRQLKDEALVAMKLVHPNIVQLRAFEENGGNPFLVMDYVEGQTLDDYLAEKGTLSEEEAVKLLKPIAAALDYAHTKGVVHRDVKPGNVMVAKDGTPYILDFGIAREIQETMTRVTGKMSSGTLLYMSPEQLRGQSPKSAQDVYSFAAMVYECLKGEPPFSRGQVEYQILNEEPEPIVSGEGRVAGQPAESILVAGVMAGLAKTPEGRPPSCTDVLEWSALVKKRREAEESKRKERERIDLEAALKEKLKRESRQTGSEDEQRLREAAARRIAALRARTAADVRGIAAPAQRMKASRPHDDTPARRDGGRASSWPLVAVIAAFAATVIFGVYNYKSMQEAPRGSGNVMNEAKAEQAKTPAERPAATPSIDNVRRLARARELFSKHEYKVLLTEFPSGDGDIPPEIAYMKSIVYCDGLVDGQFDLVKARLLLEQAAKDGSACSALELGFHLCRGDMGFALAKDESRGRQMIRSNIGDVQKAAHRGDGLALYLMGALHDEGLECKKDESTAASYFKRSADAGCNRGICMYGLCLLNGAGAAKDEDAGIARLELAAKHGSLLAAYFAAEAYLERGDERTADMWFKKSAKGVASAAGQGVAVWQRVLAFMYYSGRGVSQDVPKGLYWADKAFGNGDAAVCGISGAIYQDGNGVPANLEKAREWFERGYGLGDGLSDNNLGVMYLDGNGVAADAEKARFLFTKAIEHGNSMGAYNLGKMYEQGNGVLQDTRLAEEYYAKAVDMGCEQANADLEIIRRKNGSLGNLVPRVLLLPTVDTSPGELSREAGWVQTRVTRGGGDVTVRDVEQDGKKMILVTASNPYFLRRAELELKSGDFSVTVQIDESDIRACQRETDFIRVEMTNQKCCVRIMPVLDGDTGRATITKGVARKGVTTDSLVVFNINDVGKRHDFEVEFHRGADRYVGSGEYTIRPGRDNSFPITLHYRRPMYCPYLDCCRDLSSQDESITICPFCNRSLLHD